MNPSNRSSAPWFELKTDPDLLARLKVAATQRMTPDEAFEQKVSYVFSLFNFRSTITKNQVRAMLQAAHP